VVNNAKAREKKKKRMKTMTTTQQIIGQDMQQSR